MWWKEFMSKKVQKDDQLDSNHQGDNEGVLKTKKELNPV